MNKKTTIVLAAVALLLGGVFFYFKGRRYEVVITQEQIDAKLVEKFPVSKKYLLIFEIIYSNPVVTLLEDEDRIEVGLDATLNIRVDKELKELGGGCTITSGLRYDAETQEFFLDDAVFSRLEIQGVPESYLEAVTAFSAKAAKEYIEKCPIYRLKATDAKTTAAKLLLKDFEVKDQAIYVTMGL
ncbi:MAG: DUF1439 domain-containing protein [Luteolibacter sp.]